MTLQQEIYSKIDQMTDESIRILIDIIDNMNDVSVSEFERGSADSELTKAEKKERFIQSAGKIRIDGDAIEQLRERSMI